MSDEPVQPPQPSNTPSPAVLAETPKFLIDSIFPSNELHLISGPSGVGKTRWMVPLIDDWYHARPVLDKPSHPQAFGYLVCDRTTVSTSNTIRSMGYNPEKFLLKSLMRPNGHDPSIDDLDELFPRHIRVIFIEAVAIFVPGGKINDYKCVWLFHQAVNNLIHKRKHLTIIATTHTSKAREGEGLVNVREKSTGSVMWGGGCGTTIDMAFADPKDAANSDRLLTICPRDSNFGPPIKLAFDTRGRLVPAPEDQSSDFLLDLELKKLPFSEELQTALFMDLGDKHKIIHRTIERWLQRKLNAGHLERLRKGIYRRINPS